MMSNVPLRLTAGALVILIALLHVLHPSHGIRGVLIYWQAGTLFIDPRPVTFTVSGLALIAGVLAAWRDVIPRKPAYLAGILTVSAYLLGYVMWHLTGHGGLWPGLEPRTHGGNPVSILITHLVEDTWERTTKALESITIVLLSYLYVMEAHSPKDQ